MLRGLELGAANERCQGGGIYLYLGHRPSDLPVGKIKLYPRDLL